MKSDKFDDWLEQTLAEDNYIDDAGFTESVMERLPQSTVSPGRVRGYNWLAGGLSGLAVALVFPWSQVAVELSALGPELWMEGAIVAGALLTCASIAVGFWSVKARV